MCYSCHVTLWVGVLLSLLLYELMFVNLLISCYRWSWCVWWASCCSSMWKRSMQSSSLTWRLKPWALASWEGWWALILKGLALLCTDPHAGLLIMCKERVTRKAQAAENSWDQSPCFKQAVAAQEYKGKGVTCLYRHPHKPKPSSYTIPVW